MVYGHIVDPDNGAIVDEVLCVFMKGPSTYTAEDTAEINCHGGMIPLRKTLELVLRCGARIAEPGEFTKRAFFKRQTGSVPGGSGYRCDKGEDGQVV